VPDPVLSGERVTLRPLGDDDLDALADIISSPGVREWWGPIESAEQLSSELAEDPAFAIEVDGELAGWLGFEEVDDPNYMQAALDIVLAPPFQDRGLGPEALRLAIRWFTERGHHRFTIDPAADNERAIAAYRAVGFRDVGVLRRYERGADGEWHDNLLMELLAEEQRE
jgi:aminoglycoside 6'-N-acetyltransferase